MSTLCMWLLFSLCHVQSLWPHELQDARLPCPSLSPRVCSNSCLVSQWCHSAIHSSVARFLPAFNLSIKVLPHRSAFSFHSLWYICKLCTPIHVFYQFLKKDLYWKFEVGAELYFADLFTYEELSKWILVLW